MVRDIPAVIGGSSTPTSVMVELSSEGSKLIVGPVPMVGLETWACSAGVRFA